MRPLPSWLLGAVGALAGGAPSGGPPSTETTPAVDDAGPAKEARTAPSAARLPGGVALVLEAPTTRGPWRVRLVNQSEAPVAVVADARFLRLDVTPRGAHKASRCELPASMRPADALERALVLPPGAAYVETFEPRLYCFGRLDRALLAPGSMVAARLGWPNARRGSWVSWPLEGSEASVTREHVLVAPPVGLPDEPVPPTAQPTTLSASDGPMPRLSLSSPVAIDAPSDEDLEIPITLRNEASSPVTVRFRPETLGFDVATDGAFEHCVWPAPPAAPMRELFTTLPPSATTQLTVTLPSYCAGKVLERSGLLWVRPWLDTRAASGAPLGVRTFDGLVFGADATLIRLQRGRVSQPLSPPTVAK